MFAAHETHPDETLLDGYPVPLHVGRAQRRTDARPLSYAAPHATVSAPAAGYRGASHRGTSGAL